MAALENDGTSSHDAECARRLEAIGADLRRLAHDLANATMVIDSSVHLIEQGQDVQMRCRSIASSGERLVDVKAELDALATACGSPALCDRAPDRLPPAHE